METIQQKAMIITQSFAIAIFPQETHSSQESAGPDVPQLRALARVMAVRALPIEAGPWKRRLCESMPLSADLCRRSIALS